MVEQEREGKLTFLDILINRHAEGMLGRSEYRKATHTELYFNTQSHHHPTQKWGMMFTLLEWAHRIANKEYPEEECRHLQHIFLWQEIQRTFAWYDGKKKRVRSEEEEEPIRGVSVVPFYWAVTNRLARLLSCRNIRTISKLKQMLRPGKDTFGLKVPGV